MKFISWTLALGYSFSKKKKKKKKKELSDDI